MDLFVTLGVVGSVASVIGLILPANGKRERLMHAVYGLVIAVLAGTATHYQGKLARIEAVERTASKLAYSRGTYSAAGFVHAGLAFLEKNRDLFPDSYLRAQKLCDQHDCYSSGYGEDRIRGLDHGNSMISAASTMEDLLRGIAAISSSRQQMQAGRELRIMVLPEQINDEEMTRLSEETARRIEAELQYPGQIKVVVIRETRAVDFAR